ncbi:malate dehydrogenase (oxaloacetate-decarboxylating) [Enterococcus asini ATCC 700915]|uniref:Malolactic enzyme n=2 Tax=Enterococcus asini TaxID=57732 RepID=R2PJ68_9ENTE|nr:malolactic enzyme [Enterococcus asini]EOH84417.1 malate dehydrogenase (oxaloacetate-decarboxylating) [Enterococcus asini ATCC 700915]EOT57291.1 malate dehydrogenase (oxaloacetate-decarboxylating) [Enterococcus asini ATCC 700915]MDT2810525.1 malolactic enzyme [Enterococcus asini]OJG12027.1 malate dehydrogenase (oxaloacetate-decarboxylating) [Enterococcus asini]
MLTGANLLNNPFLNKGTAFTKEERAKYGLTGMLPATVQTLEQQSVQAYGQYLSKPSDLEKRIFLMNIFNTNRTLFYKLMGQHIVEFMPVVYDPVVADSIEQYNEIFVKPQDAAFLSVDAPEDIKATLQNAADGRDIRLIVATDAEGILGMGDWGVNGVDIAIGKLMVYTAAAGINPNQVLPVSIDAGTNNQVLLNDPLYLGNRHERLQGEAYMEFIDQFVSASTELFPELLLHWEDFGRGNAANILAKYQDKITTFNDDIQGTGIVVLAGVLGGLNISKAELKDQIVLTYGAGTAGVGIAEILLDEMVRSGIPEAEARTHFYQVDKQGLLFDDMDDLTPGQTPFARKRSEFANSEALTSLEEVVKAIHPTIMIGTSTQPGTFTESIVKEMAAHTERPIIMPLSNPTKLAEATAEDLIKWTDGRALVGTGIPAADVEYNGVTYEIGQANNALMYPGLGLGLIASTAMRVTSQTISDASHALGGIVDVTKPGASILPPVSKLNEFSRTIAETVVASVLSQNLNREPIDDVKTAVDQAKWVPEYTDLTEA